MSATEPTVPPGCRSSDRLVGANDGYQGLKKRIVRTVIHEVVANIDDDASEIVL